MSEEILKALMQLFAIIAKQDEGVEDNEVLYVHGFLRQQLSAEAVDEYFKLFHKKAGVDKLKKERKKAGDKDGAEPRKPKLTSVKDSVRILGLCKKINKQLNQSQKAIVLVRLFELVNADRKFSDQRMAIINTVAEVFNVSKEEFKNIETFVIYNDYDKLDNQSTLLVTDKEFERNECRRIKVESLDGDVIILQIKSVDLYFMRYTGSQDIYLNGLSVNNRSIYLFANGSAIKLPKGKPIYYSDVVSNYMSDATATHLSFSVEKIDYRFASNELGLRAISFSEEHGKLIGIMGASGAGKTTLLNVLSGINKPSAGQILINGINLHTQQDKIEGVIGYIPQDDLLIEELTVFQNLYFSAKQCFNDKTEEEIVDMVHKTLRSLGLYERKDLKVGSPLNKLISGGQRKRLNIALELIREPSILFVDEPTSGLSSRDSENVMDLLSELTLKGKLIFVVIHQPSSDIYKMFDKMIILDTGGYMIYYGNPVEALMYFKRIDAQINSEVGECTTCGNVNPELIFNIVEARVVDEFGNYTEKRKMSPPNWEKHFYKNIQKNEIPKVQDDPPTTLNIPSWFKQFKIYTLRDFFSKISNTQYVLISLLEAPLLAFILSFIIYYIADPHSVIYIFRENENIPPYIFMSIIVALFIGLTVSAEEIFRDRKILKREKFLNLSRSSYLISKVFILFTLSAVQSLLYVLVGNLILGVEGMMFDYWCVMFATSAFANMLGLNISASFNSAVTIYILIPLLMIPQMALGGAMFSFDKLNRILGTAGKVPVVAEIMASRWAYEALMVHQFMNNEFESKYFEIEQEESIGDFKQVYYLPRLEEMVTETMRHQKENTDSTQKIARRDIELLHNELSKEKRRNVRLQTSKIEKKIKRAIEQNNDKKIAKYKKEEVEDLVPQELIDNLTFELFSDSIANEALLCIDDLKDYYTELAFKADDRKDKIVNYLDSVSPNYYNKRQARFHNAALADYVTNFYEKNKILRYKDKLVQQVDPVFLDPDDFNFFDFRCHFYAPRKYFMGYYFDTFNFNIVIIWLMTTILYISLYFDSLTRTISFIGRIKIPWEEIGKKIAIKKLIPKKLIPKKAVKKVEKPKREKRERRKTDKN